MKIATYLYSRLINVKNNLKGGEELLAKTILIIVLTNFVLSGACKNNRVVSPDNEINAEVEKLAGFYKATTFTALGSSDGVVDILAGGGILVTQLYSNFTVEGYYFMPDTIPTDFPPRDMLYKGTFQLTDDTLRFFNTDVEGLEQFPFIVHDDSLETPDISGRLAPFKTILTRKYIN